jgi:hypothetical protein
MRFFLAILFRCVLALGLGFTPVANALSMAAMATPQPAPQEDNPPCHAPSEDHKTSQDKCCGNVAQCHCAMATALPTCCATLPVPTVLSEHPQTARPFPHDHSIIPDTPPPRLTL